MKLMSLVFSILLLVLSTDLWAITAGFNVQGRLTKPDGTNVTDGDYTITFSLYALAEGQPGEELYWQQGKTVPVKNGNFQATLEGYGTAPGPTDKKIEDMAPGMAKAYIQIKVNNDPPLVPRQPLFRSPLETNDTITSLADAVVVGDNDANGSGGILLKTRNESRVVVTNDGKVGIGVSQPAQQLSVNGAVQSLSGGFKFPDGTVQASLNCTYRLKVVSAPTTCSYSDSPSGSNLDCFGHHGFSWTGLVFAICYSCGPASEFCGPFTTMNLTEQE